MLYMLYDIIVLKPFIMFLMTTWSCDYYCDYDIWCDWYVTVWSWYHSNPNPESKKKKKKKKIK